MMIEELVPVIHGYLLTDGCWCHCLDVNPLGDVTQLLFGFVVKFVTVAITIINFDVPVVRIEACDSTVIHNTPDLFQKKQ